MVEDRFKVSLRGRSGVMVRIRLKFRDFRVRDGLERGFRWIWVAMRLMAQIRNEVGLNCRL